MNSLWKTPAYLLMLGIVSASVIPSSNHMLHTASCPEAGFYYSEGTRTGLEAPCLLCFCQLENSTTVCKETAKSLCDQATVSRDLASSGKNRTRRSPIGLSDIFFRDATRDFFDKQLPQQCKPYESSFSDGCPPADWCVGCTVCDCDANGRWDCHILSFCNGEESKHKLRGKVPLPKNMPTRRVYDQNKSMPKTKVTRKPKKVVKKSIPKPQSSQNKNQNASKQMNNNRKLNNNGKKPNKSGRKPNNNGKKPKVNAKKPDHKRRNQPKRRPRPNTIHTTKKPVKKRYMVKKPQHLRNAMKRRTTPRPQRKNVLRKAVNVVTAEPQSEITKLINNQSNLDESVLGRRIIKQVMSTVQSMLAKQMQKLQNITRVQRSINGKNKKNCSKNKQKKEKILNDYNLRKKKLSNYRQHYNFRKKRAALDLDLSIIELNDANLMKDNTTEDLSVKRFYKKNTDSDFRDSNITKTHLTDNNTTNKYVTDNITTEKYSENSTSYRVLNSITTNQYYKYSIDKNSMNLSFSTESASIQDETNKTSMVLNPMVTDKYKNITGRNVERAKQYAIVVSDPKFNDLKHKEWDTMQILRDYTIKINQISKFDKANRQLNNSNAAKSMNKRYKNKIRRKNIQRKLGVSNKHNLKKVITYNLKTVPSNYFGTTLTPTNTSYNISSLQILLQNLMKELNRNTTSPTKLNTNFSLYKYLKNIFIKIFSKKKGNRQKSHKTKNDGMTLEILCDNIGACFLNKHNRIALRYKIHDMNEETEKIFKTIKIIKGLLLLIEKPLNKENNTKKNLNDEIQKLDAILRGTYGENITLTETQAAQISYVKENIHQFIESVGRFAKILNEIIGVLYKNNKTYSCQRNLRLLHKKRKLNSFNKIKNLLVKYNIMQNTFMKKMYQLVTDVEKNMTTENTKPKVSDRDLNNTQVIDKYSKNIIENLRKLKNLAQALNSSRQKRQTMREDDAIEYLLMLMEYLLKQNQPLDTAPVNDGIDLIIEAIQSAPDIKPIKKKVLDEHPTTKRAIRTTTVDQSYLKIDSDSNRISKEENNSSINQNNLTKEEVLDNDEESTQVVYYKRFNDNDNTTINNDFYTTTEYAFQNVKERGDTGEKIGFDRFESDIDDTRRYEVFTSDLEDEPIIPVVINTSETKPVPAPVTTKFEESTIVSLQDYKLDDDPAPKKTKLDWIEENFSKEIRDDNFPDTTISPTYTTQAATRKPGDHSVDNISGLTIELEDEEKKKRSKSAADDVMLRKQMAFLNLLDYGTERSEFEDSELKDGEKYSDDAFPSYFV